MITEKESKEKVINETKDSVINTTQINTKLSNKEMSELKLPKKAGDKFNMTRFHEGLSGWVGSYTVKGFKIGMWDKTSPVFSKLSRLLKYKPSNATIKENIEKSLLDSDYKHHQIDVLIKETGGSIALRYCIKE